MEEEEELKHETFSLRRAKPPIRPPVVEDGSKGDWETRGMTSHTRSCRVAREGRGEGGVGVGEV